VADPRRAAAAAGSAACVLAGAAAVTVAVMAGPGPGLSGYVSEAGIPSSGYASAYRLGIFALAAGQLLLAAALPPAMRLAAWLLVAGAACTAVSGVVTCSDGCPLPPFEHTTAADLVHGGASIAAVATCVFAMLAVLLSPPAPARLRRLSGAAAAVALPLSAAVGLAMLILGRGAVVGVVERILLAVAALWLLGTAATVATEGVTDARRRTQRATGR
jgi:hypothetical protein